MDPAYVNKYVIILYPSSCKYMAYKQSVVTHRIITLYNYGTDMWFTDS